MKKLALILLIIVLLAGGYYYFNSRKSDLSSETPPVENTAGQTPMISKQQLQEIYSNNGIGLWGFAAIDDGVCYASSDGSLSLYNTQTKQETELFTPSEKPQSVKIVSLAKTCLAEYFYRDENLLYMSRSGQKAELLNLNPTGPVYTKSNYFTIQLNDKWKVLDQDGTEQLNIEDKEQLTFQIAPFAKDSYFAIGPYDNDINEGTLKTIENGSEGFAGKIKSAVNLFANSKTGLFIYQQGNSILANLIDKNGTTIKTVRDINPESVIATEEGYYFITAPGGPEDDSSDNGLGYLLNSGESRNLISSTDESDQRYQFSALSLIGDKLYASEQGKVYSVELK